MITLYSKRWSIAKGWYWKYERECEKSSANEWFNVFQKDEPEVDFVLSNKEPKVR